MIFLSSLNIIYSMLQNEAHGWIYDKQGHLYARPIPQENFHVSLKQSWWALSAQVAQGSIKRYINLVNFFPLDLWHTLVYTACILFCNRLQSILKSRPPTAVAWGQELLHWKLYSQLMDHWGLQTSWGEDFWDSRTLLVARLSISALNAYSSYNMLQRDKEWEVYGKGRSFKLARDGDRYLYQKWVWLIKDSHWA